MNSFKNEFDAILSPFNISHPIGLNQDGIEKLENKKCGEIFLNYGKFELNCNLCQKKLLNIRSFAKHVLKIHFNSDTEILIEELLNGHSEPNIKEEENNLLGQANNIGLVGDINDCSDNSSNRNNDNDKVNDHSSESEAVDNKNKLPERSTTKRRKSRWLTSGSEKDEKNEDTDIDDVPLNTLRTRHQFTKKKSDKRRKINGNNSTDQNDDCELMSAPSENEDENSTDNEYKPDNENEDVLEENIKGRRKRRSNNTGDEKPVCKICGKQTAKYKMRQHMRSHDNTRYVHQCKTCLKLFISEKSLNLHVKNLHTEEKPFVCEIENCGKRYVDENALNAHIKRHGERPFSCELCGKGFIYQSRLNDHVSQHLVKLRKETGMDVSQKTNQDSNPGPDETINSVAVTEDDGICNTSTNEQTDNEIKFDPTKRRKFQQKQVIKIKKPKAPNINPKPSEKMICDICGKETPKANMRQHLRSHDNTRYTHKCEMCDKLFISEKSLELHIKNLHTKDRPFECPYEHCEKRFVNDNSLKAHLIRHTSPREFKCQTCNKGFIYQYRLDEHIKVYHVNGRIFGCDVCDKRFFDKHTLERHKIVHSGEKPFACDECPARFSRERSLAWHKKSHTGVKDYICKVCGKEYALYNGIYSHMKTHGIKYSIAYEKGLTDGKDFNLSGDENEMSG